MGILRQKQTITFSLLYENDAVEYIYQFIKTSNHKYSLYNLSSNDVVSEVKLAAMISESYGNRIEYCSLFPTVMEDVFCRAIV